MVKYNGMNAVIIFLKNPASFRAAGQFVQESWGSTPPSHALVCGVFSEHPLAGPIYPQYRMWGLFSDYLNPGDHRYSIGECNVIFNDCPQALMEQLAPLAKFGVLALVPRRTGSMKVAQSTEVTLDLRT